MMKAIITSPLTFAIVSLASALPSSLAFSTGETLGGTTGSVRRQSRNVCSPVSQIITYTSESSVAGNKIFDTKPDRRSESVDGLQSQSQYFTSRHERAAKGQSGSELRRHRNALSPVSQIITHTSSSLPPAKNPSKINDYNSDENIKSSDISANISDPGSIHHQVDSNPGDFTRSTNDFFPAVFHQNFPPIPNDDTMNGFSSQHLRSGLLHQDFGVSPDTIVNGFDSRKESPFLAERFDVNPVDFIMNEISSHDVVIFSTTYCPLCDETKKLFQSMNVDARVIELDLMKNGLTENGVAVKLYELTGQRTVPNVFIRGMHLGGNDLTQEVARTGSLHQTLGLEFDSLNPSLECYA